jgi:transcriptional regulator with XRE-family HTH domain
MEELQRKLKELRKKRGWSQEDLAHEVGVSLSTIQRWERQGGKRLFRLARKELMKLFQEAGIDVRHE